MTEDARAQALSNLRCPSPPPILKQTAPNPVVDELLPLPDEDHHKRTPSMHAHFNEPGTHPRSRLGSTSLQNHEKDAIASDVTKQMGKVSLDGASGGSNSTRRQLPAPVGLPVPEQANIDPRLQEDDGKTHILLGVCGALLTVKIKLIIHKLFENTGR